MNERIEQNEQNERTTRGRRLWCEAGLKEYENLLQTAVKACVDGLETLKADVEKAVNYAVKRLRTSIATLVRWCTSRARLTRGLKVLRFQIVRGVN